MRALNRFDFILGLALVSAQAQATDFSFTSGSVPAAFGNAYTATVGSLTLTASAWSDTLQVRNTQQFESAALTLATDGMGVCNQVEKLNCGGNKFPDALGNKSGNNDLILFSFSSAVSLRSLTMLQVGSDSDLSLWAGTGSFSPNGLQASSLGTATLYDNTNSVSGTRIVSLTAFAGTYDWLAVAAHIGQIDDLAKLQSLTITPVAQPVPEADTWIMLLAGLGLVGFAVSRRTQT